MYNKISHVEAKKIMDTKEDIIILDVRTAEEYNEGHIDNAVLLPVDELEGKAEEVLVDKDREILVYCRSGKRSMRAVELLDKMGYSDIKDFGGIIDWNFEIVM